MKDITYCTAAECPFTDCERHIDLIKGRPPGSTVSAANFCGTCRQYIGWLADTISKDEKHGFLKGD